MNGQNACYVSRPLKSHKVNMTEMVTRLHQYGGLNIIVWFAVPATKLLTLETSIDLYSPGSTLETS